MAIEVTPPFKEFTDLSGAPLDNGYIYIGTENLNPEVNPISIYWDSAMTIPASNPLRTISGYPARNGFPARIYCGAQYSITVKDKSGVLVYSSLSGNLGSVVSYVDSVSNLATLDNINTASGTVIVKDLDRGGTFIWSSTGTANGGTVFAGATGYWNRQYSSDVNVKWFGAKGDGVIDDTTSFISAISFVSSNAYTGSLFIPSGRFLITDTLNIPEGLQIYGDKMYQYKRDFGIYPNSTTIIFNPSSLKSLFVLNGTTHSSFRIHVSIMNIYIEGNSFDALGNSNYAIEVNNLIYGVIKNVTINKTFRTGIKCTGTINNRFENIYISGRVQCVEYQGLTETTDVWEQCTFADSPKGITLGGTTIGLRFNNCLLEAIDDYGVDISATTQNAVFSNIYVESVPLLNNVIDNSVFRVGSFGVSEKGAIQLSVIGGSIRGNNTSTIGSAFYIKDVDGVHISDVFIRKFVNIIDSTNATRANSISLSNVSVNTFTNLITDTTKVQGTYYSGAVTDVTRGELIRVENAFAATYRSKISGTGVVLSTGTTNFTLSNVNVYPSVDNSITLGLGSFRWSVVYAGTGTINTSDERLKTFIDIESNEIECAKALKGMIRKFKFNDSIAIKGLDARIHYGVGAQSVVEKMIEFNLDPMKYGFICYDTWEETAEVYGENGEIIQAYTPAGDRYGIRYEELLCFIISAM